jgi:hypothetical protein
MSWLDKLFGATSSTLLQLQMSCFNMGKITATPNATALCEALGVFPLDLVQRHASGDFGVIDAQQREYNQRAMSDARYHAISAYPLGSAVLYVVTKQGESTTVMTANDYVFYAQGRGAV